MLRATGPTRRIPSNAGVCSMQRLASPSPPLPVLDRMVRVPVLAPDGSLRRTPGYHRPGLTYLDPAPGLIVPMVSDTPTSEAVARAVHLIMDELLIDFPFTGPAER